MDSSSNQNRITFEREIDLKEISYLISKNRKLIIFFGIVLAIFSFIASSFQEKIYRGKFKIIVNNQTTSLNNSGLLDKFLSSEGIAVGLGSKNMGENIETTIQIIEGPVVLNSVYDFVQSNKNEKALLSFEQWVKQLKIEQVPDTSILEVSYIDNDKELILNSLERIKKVYKEYSIERVTKEINTSYEFLKSQYFIAKNKANESIQKLNKFALENGLGNFDGIPLLSPDSNEFDKSVNQSSEPFDSNNRYYELFNALQQLETEYTRLSSLLNEESSILINLKSQIEKFKSSLQRPNEILMQFNDLIRESSNDYSVVQSLDSQLRAVALERVKKQKSWEVLSEPRLEKKPITWSKKKSTVIGLIIGIFLGVLYTIMKGFSSGIIFTKNSFLGLIPYKYLLSISLKNKEYNDKLFTQIIKTISKDKLSQTGILYLVNEFNPEIKIFSDELDSQANARNVVTSNRINELSNCTKIILLAFADTISTSDLDAKIDLIKLQDFEVTGWVFVN